MKNNHVIGALGTSLFTLASFIGISIAAPRAASAQQKIAIPSYFYPSSPVPSGLWQQLESSVPTVGLALVNPNSGPGATSSANYAQLVSTKPQGLKMLGYVYSQGGARAIASVQADIDKYYSWYPQIDGIFIDEADNTSCNIESSYYLPLYNYIKSKSANATVVLNPGTSTLECYVNASDILITFESTYTQYSGSWSSSHSWETKYPASRFWHLVHGTSSAQMASALSLSQQRNAGWIYVTDDVMNNPWDTLASYFSSEVSSVAQTSAPIAYYSAQADTSTFTYQATFNQAFNYHHVFIDTDVNASTGYTVAGIGADYMIENGTLYRAAANGNVWSWTNLGAVTVTGATGTATGARTWTVARSTLGEGAANNNSRVVFHGSGTSPDYFTPIVALTAP
jgi:hypothetical protein